MTATATKSPPASAAPVKAALPPVLSLDDRILAALRDHAASDVIAGLVTEAEDAVAAAEKHYAAAKERAIDPTLPGEAVAEARRAMEDNDFIRQRMHEAARRLKDELDVAKGREAAAARKAEIDEFVAQRDDLVKALRENYPLATSLLVTLFKWLDLHESERARLGLPDESSAECVARGMGFYVNGQPVWRLRQAQLPAFNGTGLAWPK